MTDYLEIAVGAAKEAGSYLLEHFGRQIKSDVKTDFSRVTECDKHVEKMIRSIIMGRWPNHGFTGEEFGVSNPSSEYKWVIDPVDGTHNFIQGIPMFGVSIGLLRRGEFCGGVIYMPCEKKMYIAEKGAGAYRNGERIQVSATDSIKDATLLFDSGLRQDPDPKLKFLASIASKLLNVRMLGASVQNLTLLAEGKADMLVEFNECLWDFAAGLTIVQEAGGRITNHDNSPVTTDSRKYIATNGILHDDIIPFFI
ncbi:MAG: inositol monophosphatase [Spirochaetales bacterium]|nr:inositol monophosphatase [Spirochaetales bacterium]